MIILKRSLADPKISVHVHTFGGDVQDARSLLVSLPDPSRLGVVYACAHLRGGDVQDARTLLVSLPDSYIDTILPPHKLFHFLHENAKSGFSRYLSSDPARLAAFWQRFVETPHGRSCRSAIEALHADDLSHTIPVVLHGDGGPFSKTRSAMFVQWGALLSSGAESDTRFFAMTYVKGLEAFHGETGWRYLLWSFDVLASGVHPFADFRGHKYLEGSEEARVAGTPLAVDADGSMWRCALVYAKADLEFWANEIGFPHWSSSGQVCAKCRADRGGLNYKDLRSCAAHRSTVYDDASFRARFAAPDAHPLRQYICRLGPGALAEDILHIVDYNGVAAHAVANSLATIVRGRELGAGSQAATLAAINTELQAFYTDRRSRDRFPEITMAMLQANLSEYPVLHGPSVKGATTRGIVPFVADICRRLDDGSFAKHRRAVMTGALARMYDIMYGSDVFFSDNELCRFRQAIYEFLVNYHSLAAHHAERGELYYNVVFKHHFLGHVSESAASLNPRCLQTYTEESNVGRGAAIYAATANGPFENTVQRAVLSKFVLALTLRWTLQ
jgi:hypothetical protein